MTISSFALGILIGSLAMLMFIYIVAAIASTAEKKKKQQLKQPIISDDVIFKLWKDYMDRAEERKADDGK